MSPEFWINLQSRFDLALASRQSGNRILQEVAVRAAG
jgi:plasmid maintenance system antidote protein VapI